MLKLPKYCECIIKIHPSENTKFYNKIIRKINANIDIIVDPFEKLDICKGDIAININSTAGYDACLKGALILNVLFENIPSPIDFKSYNLGDNSNLQNFEKTILILLQKDFISYESDLQKFKLDFVNTNVKPLSVMHKKITS